MDEHLNLVPLNLQFFADPVPVDMRLVADITDLTKPPKYLFTTMSAADEEDQGENEDETGSEIITEEYEPDDPLLFPRLAVTDQNLPHTAVGEAVVRSAEGELYTVSVEKDGTVTDSSFQIGADNIEEGSITGSKLEESTITTRELDMAEIFADATALNQTLVENLDTSSLFNNDNFLTRLDERVNEQMADKAVLKEGGTMTGPLVLNGKPEQEFGAATKQYVDAAIAGQMPGNAATAAKLKEAKTISLGGKVIGTATAFDGTENVTINATEVDATTFCGKDLSYFETQGDQGYAEALVADGLAASKKTYVSNDWPTDTLKHSTEGIWAMPDNTINNMFPPDYWKIENEYSNNFRSGWTAAYEKKKVIYAAEATAGGASLGNVYPTMNQRSGVKFIKDHLYYTAGMGSIYRTAESGTFVKGAGWQIQLNEIYGIVSNWNYGPDELPPLKENAKAFVHSDIFKAPYDRTGLDMTCYLYAPQTGSIGSTATGTTYYELSNLLLVDLTEHFGAGAEPDLKLCDKLFQLKTLTDTVKYSAGDRWVIPYKNIKNLISPDFLTGNYMYSCYQSSGVSLTSGAIKMTVADVNTVVGTSKKEAIYKLEKPYVNILATHIYYVAAMGSIYRTAASGTFAKGGVCQIDVNGLGTLKNTGIDESPPLQADAKIFVLRDVFTAQQDSPVINVAFSFTSTGTARIGSTVSGTTYYELGDLLVIDLTEYFGAGTEPDVKACDSLFLKGPLLLEENVPCALNMRTYFSDVQFGGKAFVLTDQNDWSEISLLTYPRPTYATAAAGFSFAAKYPKYRRNGKFVYFEIKCTVTTAMTAGQVKPLTTNAMLALPAMPGKFLCHSSVTTHQTFLQMTRTADNIVQLHIQAVAAVAANTVIHVSGMYLADDDFQDLRVV